MSTTNAHPLRIEHIPQGFGVKVHPKLPDGWREITQGFGVHEAGMLYRVAADLRGESFGQSTKDAVEFALLDSHNGLSVIRPTRQLKLGND